MAKINKRKTNKKKSSKDSGKLRIGDNWNAITIIALSQSNPLKSVAEFLDFRGGTKADVFLDRWKNIPNENG